MKMVNLSKVVATRLRNLNNNSSRVSSSFFSSETPNNNPSSSSSSSSSPSSSSSSNLFHRVQLIRDPKASVLPVLHDWVSEGRPVHKSQLGWLVRTMKDFRRYHHALQVSMWMTDSRFIKLSPRDVALRLDLIYKVHGLERAEDYFNTTSSKLKTHHVYGALLNSYVHENRVDKAESVMTEMRNNGLADTSFPYNVLVDLYSKNGEYDKVDKLMQEMERNGIARDKFTLRNLMSSCIRASDVSGIKKILRTAEERKDSIVDWKLYSIAAEGYLKLGMKENALGMLRKLKREAERAQSRKRKTILGYLITLYAGAGERDELFKLWDTFELPSGHKGGLYTAMITSLAKLDDIASAERLFGEWESQCTTYDFRVVNCLLSGYCKKGLLDKAESLLKRVLQEGATPYASSWNMLANGYAENGQLPKAIEMLNKTLIGREKFSPNYVTLGKCLDYLKELGDVSGIEEILTKLKDSEVLTVDAYLRLLRTCNASGESFSGSLCQMYVNGSTIDGKAYKIGVDGSCSDEEENDEICGGTQ